MLPVATHIMIIANHQSPTITPIAMIVACSFYSSFMTCPLVVNACSWLLFNNTRVHYPTGYFKHLSGALKYPQKGTNQ